MVECEIIEDAPKQKYSFDEGVEAVITKVEELFASGLKNVVVGINGAVAHVGKTTLAKGIRKALEDRVPTQVLRNVEELEKPVWRLDIQSRIKTSQEKTGKQKLLIIIEQAFYGSQTNTGNILKTAVS